MVQDIDSGRFLDGSIGSPHRHLAPPPPPFHLVEAPVAVDGEVTAVAQEGVGLAVRGRSRQLPPRTDTSVDDKHGSTPRIRDLFRRPAIEGTLCRRGLRKLPVSDIETT